MSTVNTAAANPIDSVSPEFISNTFKKISWRFMPYVVIAYIMSFIDRVNLGFAALQMNKDLAFSSTVFGYGAGVLFVGYLVFGVPSNMLLHKIGARRVIGTLLALWGALAACMSFVHNEMTFYFIRFLLGAAEAGFFPGVILFFSYWYPKQRLGTITGLFMFALPISSMLGSLISGYLLALDGVWGIAGWKWMFFLEGIPACLWGIVGFFYLTDKPDDATWLTTEEKSWLSGVLKHESELARQASQSVKQEGFWDAITNWRVILLAFTYLCMTNGVYGLNLWLPQIIKAFGDIKVEYIGLISAIPFLVASVGMILVGMSSDKFRERKWHVTLCCILMGCCFYLATLTGDSLPMTILVLSIGGIGVFACLPVFWTIPPTFLAGSTRAAGIGVINAIGNLGGLVSPIVIGKLRDATGTFHSSFIFLTVIALVTAALIFFAASKSESNLV